MIARRWPAVIFAAGMVYATILAVHLSAAPQEGERSVWDGVYTTAQATHGATLFDKECAGCHGPSGRGGGMAPALTGAAFSANYDGLTVFDLFDRNRRTMPPGNEGQLASSDLVDITAFILQFNSFPAGSTELPSNSMMLKSIKYLAAKP